MKARRSKCGSCGQSVWNDSIRYGECPKCHQNVNGPQSPKDESASPNQAEVDGGLKKGD